MKTDRRHELQTNVLADWIGKHLQQLQGYSKTILAVILLIIAAAIAGTFLAQDQAARAQASWNQFFQAFSERDPEALEVVATANQGTTAAVWAHLAEADLKLSEGIQDLYTNRDNAKENLAAAEKSYLAVEQTTTEKLLRERAWFGLGQAYESLAELEKARQYYGKLANSSPASALGKEAQLRIDALSSPSTEKWYNWFANQTPRPPAIPGMPGDLGMPDVPADLGDLSDRPDLSFPQAAPTGSEQGSNAPATDAPEPGPELNSPAAQPEPAPEAGSATSESADKDTAPTPQPSEAPPQPAPSEPAPSEPAPSESAEPSSETPAEPASASGEDAPE